MDTTLAAVNLAFPFVVSVGIQPWEERMMSAHEQGTLVHLSNLDPEYTSGEVEVMSLRYFAR